MSLLLVYYIKLYQTYENYVTYLLVMPSQAFMNLRHINVLHHWNMQKNVTFDYWLKKVELFQVSIKHPECNYNTPHPCTNNNAKHLIVPNIFTDSS